MRDTGQLRVLIDIKPSGASNTGFRRRCMNPAIPFALLAASGMALAFAAGLGILPYRKDSASTPTLAPITCTPPSHVYARLELLFGSTRKDGGFVSETDWLDFLQTEVTPRFPDGLTVLTGLGQWRTAQGQITREVSRMLLIWHVPGPRTEGQIDAIRALYRQRFQQDSILRVDSASCVTF
jgi:hypothetical protein